MLETESEIRKGMMERAERGAASMDAHRPGWHRLIDMKSLNLGNPRYCILGQCFNEYSDGYSDGYLKGIQALRLATINDEENHGFLIICTTKEMNYPSLTECWKTLIRKRLANDQQNTPASVVPAASKENPQKHSAIHAA